MLGLRKAGAGAFRVKFEPYPNEDRNLGLALVKSWFRKGLCHNFQTFRACI
jgi:hypothetical protein